MKVLITGGAGYIGSTIASALEEAGHIPIIYDNLCRGPKAFIYDRVFYEADIADSESVRKVFREHPDIAATIHCAALIVVPESVEKPYEYYEENVVKSIRFFKLLEELGYGQIVFSSSASIYDVVEGFKVTEEAPLRPESPYAKTKYMMEMVLQDFSRAYNLQSIALRYFNPVGADPKLRSGIHDKKPTHVVGKLVEVALGKEPCFYVTGTNWPTRDGSGIRDYIHVWDLARAHVLAVENFYSVQKESNEGYNVINLGTGTGVTVWELLYAFEEVYGQEIPKKTAPPREGDGAGSFASAEKAYRLLGWQTQKSIQEGIRDALRWGETRKSLLGYT